MTKDETFLVEEDQCINCGKCVSTCAMKLYPVLIKNELEKNNLEKARSFGLMDCIECGCCAFVCPANIRLVQRIRLGKSALREKMAEERLRAELKAKREAEVKSSVKA